MQRRNFNVNGKRKPYLVNSFVTEHKLDFFSYPLPKSEFLSFNISFPEPVHCVQITGGDGGGGDIGRFQMTAFDILDNRLVSADSLPFGGNSGSSDWYFVDSATLAISYPDISYVVIEITGNTARNVFDDLIYGLVPIPSAVWLLGSALIGMVGLRKKF